MREVHVSVDIRADAGEVWNVVTNLADYRRWNPYIHSITGDLRRRHEVSLGFVDGRTVRARVVDVNRKRRLVLDVVMPVRGLLDTLHIFETTPAGEGRCSFAHRVQFRGALVPVIAPHLDGELLEAIAQEGRALRHESERAPTAAA